MFYTALSFENTAGLSIATRADCIDEEKADLLGELAGKDFSYCRAWLADYP